MITTVPNVISPKALERQIKLLESRIQELQGELTELEKMKTACQLLLGSAGLEPEKTPDAEAAPSKKRLEVHLKISELLEGKEAPVSAEDIASELSAQGVTIPGKNPDSSLLGLLKKHPDLFSETENGHWTRAKQETLMS
jgi:hypothetical protein